MERPLTTFVFVISGFAFSILSLLVESQTSDGPNSSLSPPITLPPPFSPPPPFPPPPPRHRRRPNPPPSRASSSTEDKKLPRVPPKNKNTNQGSKRSLNNGKKVGLYFVGIAAVLQICVVGFLVFKRRQLLKCKDRYESFS